MKIVEDLLSTLRSQNIRLNLDQEDNLEVVAYDGKVPSELIIEVKKHKESIVDYLKSIRKISGSELKLVNASESYPISPAQRSLWIPSQTESSTVAYNLPSVTLLPNIADITLFRKAFEAVIDRHEILRTVFRQDETGEIKQVIKNRNELDFTISSQDLRNTEEKDAKIQNYVKQDSGKPFDLENGPLIRSCLFQINENDYIFYCNMHHIISDGWSIQILKNDIQAFYESYLKETAPDLSQLTVQYKDYAQWENEKQNDNAIKKEKEYWLKELSGELPLLDFPASKRRPKIKTFDGHSYLTYIDPETTKKLKNISTSVNGSVFMGVLAALKIMIYKYTNENDIIIGFPIAGRENADLKNQIGYYVKTLSLRSQISEGDSYLTFLKKLRTKTLSAYDNQNYPFDKLVEDLKIKKDIGRSPVFDILVGYNNLAINKNNPEINYDKIEDLGSSICKTDMEFQFQEQKDHIAFQVIYNKDVYESEMVINLLDHFKELLAKIIENPNENVDDINFLTRTEGQKILEHFNNSSVGYPTDKTIVNLFEEQVQKTPDNIALVFGEKELTYKELNEQANVIANYLINKYNIIPDELVGILLKNSEHMIASVLGILKAGAAYLPINIDQPEDRIDFIIKDSNCRLVIDQNELDTILLSGFASDNPEKEISPGHLAYVIYTSGTTGQPKGTLLEHKNVVRLFFSDQPLFDFNENDVWTLFHSLSFDFSVWEMYGALLYGGKLIVLPKEITQNTPEFLKLIQDKRVTVLNQTPSAFYNLINYERTALLYNTLSLRYVIFGGEALNPSMLNSWLKRFPEIKFVNMYGITETTVHVTYKEIKEEDTISELSNIGKPIPTLNCYILDHNQKLAPIGIYGEIYVSGAGLARGYLNRQELTNQKFIPNPYKKNEKLYRSGDAGRWLNNGDIEYRGRIDDQIKIRGYRIELNEIEQILISYDEVNQAVVVVSEIEQEKFIVAYYISDKIIDKRNLKEYLSNKLPDYMIPSYYVQIDSIPLTVNGKINKKALPAVSENDLIREEYRAPETKEEKVLQEVWSDVLKHEKIGVKDNFYNLGGDSIKSIQVVSKLKQKGYILKVGQILKNPHIEDLAKLMVHNTRTIDQKEITGEVALSPIQKYFFEKDYIKNKNHYNQSVLLKSKTLIDAAILEKCIQSLTAHHDALRMNYKIDQDNWLQYNEDTQKPHYKIIFKDLRNETDELQALNDIGESLQSGIDISSGILFVVGHFRLSDGDRLALIVHHLVIDGISWRILLEDLSELYTSYTSGKTISLPQKTDSYQSWTLAQKEYVIGDKMTLEQEYWEEISKIKFSVLPVQFEASEKEIQIDGSVNFVLDKATTHKLQTQVHHVYNTEINDILLSSLALALKEVFGIEKSLIKMEGHGREDIIENIDISRTIGWFTSVYPLVLDISAADGDEVIFIKDAIRKIPNKGVGYGMLNYLKEKFTNEQIPKIQFNYLGDFGNSLTESEESVFEFSGDKIGMPVSKDNINTELLFDISGILISDQLSLGIKYSQNLYSKEKVQDLAESYERHLIDLINKLSQTEEKKITSTDLTYKNLSFADLKKINKENNVEDIYKLSPLQLGIYFHWAADPFSSVYCEQMSYSVKTGNLDPAELKQAYQKLLEKHAVLRTEFNDELATEPLQIVRKNVEGDFRFLSIENSDPETFVKEIKAKDIEIGFDLFKPSQMRLTVLDLGNQEYEFIWSHHHILIDGWCMSILINDFYKILLNIQNNTELESEVPQTYSEYIKWLDSVDEKKSLEYWKDYLKEYSNSASVPFKTDNLIDNDYQQFIETLRIEGELFSKLQAVCNNLGITQNTFIQSTWGLLLSKYNNTKDVVFGAVVSGRPGELAGVENMIGLFINTIPVRINYKSDDTVHSFLKTIHENVLASGDYHYMNLSQVQSQSELGMNLLNHIVVFENYLVQEGHEGGLLKNEQKMTVESFDVYERTNYDFDILIAPQDTFLKIDFRFNKNKYDQSLIKNMSGHFLNVITAFCENTNQNLEEIDFISEPERRLLTENFNDTDVYYPTDKTIIDLFEEQVSKFPDRLAVLENDKNYTYNELNQISNQLADYLISQYDIQISDVIGIRLERSSLLIISILGILKSGGIYLPVDINAPEKRFEYVKNDSQYKVLIDESFIRNFLDHKGEYAPVNKNIKVPSANVAYIIYTSGTTGVPKGTLIEHHSLVNRLLWMQKLYNLSENDVILQKTPNSFDVSVWELLWWTITGSKVVFLKDGLEKDPEQIVNYIAKHSVTVLHFVPSMLTQFLDYIENEPESGESLKTLTRIYTSGEALTTTASNKFHTLIKNTKLINLYGPTESTIDVTYFVCHENLTSVPIGKPIDNTKMYILDKDHKLLPVGVEGKIFISGVGLAKGYLNKPELTAEKFVTNPFEEEQRMYDTGDLGKWTTEGNIEYSGRDDDQVKIRGFRIELEEINRTLEIIPAIKMASTLKISEKLVAFILTEDKAIDNKFENDLREELSQSLPGYMIPHHFCAISEIPLTSNGKLDRKKLVAHFESTLSNDENSELIENLNAKSYEMATIWSEVLGIPINSIHPDLNFIEHGGDSLSMLKVVALSKKKGYSITIKDFMATPYLHVLENFDIQEVPKAPEPDLTRDSKPFNLAPIQQWFFDVNRHAPNFLMHASYYINNDFDMEKLKKSIDALVDHHDSLRLRFKKERGLWMQYYDYTSSCYILEEERETATLDQIIDHATKKINIEEGPLLYANIFYESSQPVMFIACHHLVMDAVSWQILINDLQLNYLK